MSELNFSLIKLIDFDSLNASRKNSSDGVRFCGFLLLNLLVKSLETITNSYSLVISLSLISENQAFLSKSIFGIYGVVKTLTVLSFFIARSRCL